MSPFGALSSTPCSQASWSVDESLRAILTAARTQLEFSAIVTEVGYDPLRVYQYGPNSTFTLWHDWSGNILPPGSGTTVLTGQIPGRIVFMYFSSDQSIQYYGFTVSNYHAY